jgi:hypothetical protein
MTAGEECFYIHQEPSTYLRRPNNGCSAGCMPELDPKNFVYSRTYIMSYMQIQRFLSQAHHILLSYPQHQLRLIIPAFHGSQ